MKRNGATEGGFDDLVARMPRNMGALISFLVHNDSRLERDAETREKALGEGVSGNQSLGENPGASLAALKDSITQFAASVTAPAVAAAGPGLAALASGIQNVAAAYGDFAKKHPEAATAVGAGALGAGGAAGGWLSWKLWTGISKFLGLGGGGKGAATAGSGVVEAAGNSLYRIVGGVAGAASLPGVIDFVTGDNRTDAAKAIDAAILDRIKSWFMGQPASSAPAAAGPSGAAGAASDFTWHLERARRADQEWRADPEAARGRALMAMPATSQQVSVSGEATVDANFKVEASSELLRIVDEVRRLAVSLPLNGASAPTGRMDSDAAPARGIGHM